MKILHATLIGLSLSTLTLNAFAAATWVDNRYAHTWGPEKNQYKIGGGHIFDNGAGVLASAMYDIGTTNQNIGRQLKSTFQEFEGWYPFKLDDQWSVTTGGLTDIDSAGSSISPYMSLDYKLNNVLSFSTRYRYNHITRRTADLNGNMSYNDAHQLDFFLNYQATDKLWLQLNPEFFINTNDFHAANGKKTHWEPSIVARYRINQHWMPYTEVAWLDKDKNNDNQIRLRVGIHYYFQ
ncbi:porin [Enterobacteriaceae bacterium ENNIH3]|nr:porin [Enterobacteriaceae bacterium ENNIH3]AUV09199.1 porin [Enterobacteriaceae bacterium ENNIH2]PWF50778.1 porin [[Kluyvera] intestini]